MESSIANGIVLHLHLQKQDRKVSSPDEEVDICNILKYCSDNIIASGGFISEIANNAVIGVFEDNDELISAEMKAASCACMVRDVVYEYRNNGKMYVMTASINSGSVIVGSSIGENCHEVMGNGITASFQLINTTQPMQISLTRRIKDKICDRFKLVDRLPILFGQKKALIFYLHTPL
jgi:hypothetical protein